MEKKFLDIHLSVEVKQNIAIAYLKFSNNTTNKIHLDQQTICFECELQRNLFSIINGRGNRLEYEGIMIKRDIEVEDFIVLNAGEKKETSVVLNEGYELVKGKKYSIQYIAFNPPYLDEQGLMKMESNKVEINY